MAGRKSVMRWMVFGIGWLATGLGALGAFLPVLPTTPFLLLALACFTRSSPRSRAWLLKAPLLGPVLNEYLEHRVVSRPAKLTAMLVLWPAIGWTATRETIAPLLGTGLVLLACGVSVYLWSLPSRRGAIPARSPARSGRERAEKS